MDVIGKIIPDKAFCIKLIYNNGAPDGNLFQRIFSKFEQPSIECVLDVSYSGAPEKIEIKFKRANFYDLDNKII